MFTLIFPSPGLFQTPGLSEELQLCLAPLQFPLALPYQGFGTGSSVSVPRCYKPALIPVSQKPHSLKALLHNWSRMSGWREACSGGTAAQGDLLSSGRVWQDCAGVLAGSALFLAQHSVLEQWHPLSSTEEGICCAIHSVLAVNVCSQSYRRASFWILMQAVHILSASSDMRGVAVP